MPWQARGFNSSTVPVERRTRQRRGMPRVDEGDGVRRRIELHDRQRDAFLDEPQRLGEVIQMTDRLGQVGFRGQAGTDLRAKRVITSAALTPWPATSATKMPSRLPPTGTKS